MSNFIIDCINGDALTSDVNDYIDTWHDGDFNITLHEYLGMKKNEYALFVQDETYLASIITAHKFGKNIVSIVKDQMSMAARSDDPKKTKEVQKWLENQGLWV
ncbi:hypothetical protein IDJ77_00205 [Mucilaginibacter sp. ZT4R22]|uniref:Phage protein n=1 Tax=Mucilaginibacter pankratovii TaxID=2772110 RepID=A0ABR7WIQ3_9SPHI|nr:hypothetical protein [Mucilaginibacter pankratovii]MBD1362215.1 hypothetical protein [Mucilaginibacter pankratovii]